MIRRASVQFCYWGVCKIAERFTNRCYTRSCGVTSIRLLNKGPMAYWWGCPLCFIHIETGVWFNIKMSSYQYRKSHCGDKTVVGSSNLRNGISYTGKITSLYWISPSDSQYLISNSKSAFLISRPDICHIFMWFSSYRRIFRRSSFACYCKNVLYGIMIDFNYGNYWNIKIWVAF